MKPFLILQIRTNNEASNNEFQAFLKSSGLKENDVHRVRMEQAGIPKLNLNDYSAVIVGGGQYDISKSEEKKTPEQKRLESDLFKLLDQVVEKDFPYFGACYGLSALVKHQKGIVSKKKYAESVKATTITLTKEGEKDPLNKGFPSQFRAFVGHKEACQQLPDNATLLASSPECPVQMIRIKNNIYGTQFHPEADTEGFILRINIYKHAGYFPPEDAEALIEEVKKENVTIPTMMLKKFVEKYQQEK